MYTIILDSSNKDLSIGIARKDKLVDEINYEAWQRQSELMIPELEKMMRKHRILKDQIDDAIVGNGPGSYTGVRISLTIGKIIATSLNVPLYAISSLQMLKDGDTPSICLINARSQRSYIGAYIGNKVVLKDQVMTNDEVLDYIDKHPDFIVCGDTSYLGIKGHKGDIIKEMTDIKNHISPVDNPLGLTPVYLKD